MKMLRSTTLVAALVLSGTGQAWATDESTFLGVLKKFGVTNNSQTSKKPCICVGGLVDERVGRLIVQEAGGGQYTYDCTVSSFDAQGTETGPFLCRALGGSVVVLNK
jgi:hypothetical protein